jgi:hypothetical protein
MTTVGYGDVVPTSGFGQFIGGIVMIFGIVVIALPITVIGSNFATIYKTHAANETMDDAERLDKEEDAGEDDESDVDDDLADDREL